MKILPALTGLVGVSSALLPIPLMPTKSMSRDNQNVRHTTCFMRIVDDKETCDWILDGNDDDEKQDRKSGAKISDTTSDDTPPSNGKIDDAIPTTPCVRICRYNADFFDGAVCIGCFRESYEIQTWASSSAQERAYTLEDAIDRLDQGSGFEGSVSRDELVRQLQRYQSLTKRCD